MQDIVEMLQDDKFTGNDIVTIAARRIKNQRAFIATSTAQQKNTVRMYEILAELVHICDYHNLEDEYYRHGGMWGYNFSAVIRHSERAIKDAEKLGNAELDDDEEEDGEEDGEDDGEDEDEEDEDEEEDEEEDKEEVRLRSLDSMPDEYLIEELEKCVDGSATDSIMLAAASEIEQLSAKENECYPKKANIAEMFENLEALYHAIRYRKHIEYITDSFDEDELYEILREAERVGNNTSWY